MLVILPRFAKLLNLAALRGKYPMHYHKTFAWLPTRMSSGALIWLNHYYIRPDHNGEGVLLTRMEQLLEQGLSPLQQE